MDDRVGGKLGEVLLKLFGVAREDRHHIGAVVDRHNMPDAQEADGVGSLERAHDEPVADGQQGKVRTVDLADKLHVAEDRGVPGVVELKAAFELDNVAHGLAAIDEASVLRLDARGVEGVSGGDPNPLPSSV